VLAALAEAETDWQEWVIARQRVGDVLSAVPVRETGESEAEAGPAAEAPSPGGTVPAASPVPQAPPTTASAPEPGRAARPGTIVPVWRPGLEAAALAVEYQRIVAVLAQWRQADADAVMTCQEIAAALGLELMSRGRAGGDRGPWRRPRTARCRDTRRSRRGGGGRE
jgi:hypothetical protein